jgi:enoyl-CoA hydratase
MSDQVDVSRSGQAPPQKPLIAAVEGYELAGGCEIVLACDLVVAAENARSGIPEANWNLPRVV